jgi:UDP-GlcNAc3NAcA epimerase
MSAPLLAVCYGTRPQVIKASALIQALQRDWPLLTIDSGQHYDYELNRLLYEQLEVPEPTCCLEVSHDNPARQLGQIIARTAEVLSEKRPWAAVVLGDTNSTLGCALAAAQLRIPVIHVEAGLRAADPLMIEEINRRAVDAVAMLLCAPSDATVARLKDERVSGTVVRTGDIARDVLIRFADRVPAAVGYPPLRPGEPYVFATLHRAELTGNEELLRRVIGELGRLDLPVILPAHPRLRAALRDYGLENYRGRAIRLLEPLGYLESIACIRDARVVITDSGGIQREAYWLGVPCITVRSETEWTETVAVGANMLVPAASAPGELVAAARRWIGEPAPQVGWDRDAYGAGDAADRVRDAIMDFALTPSRIVQPRAGMPSGQTEGRALD